MKWQRCVSVMAALVLAVTASAARADISLEMVTVGNVGNANDRTRYGGVDHVYAIGKYEVTAGQYTAFLNAVAGTDTYELYNTSMWSNQYGCKIERGGSPGSYTYGVAADRMNRPVNYVSWGDAARFMNWLHNGQPTGAQDLTTTEDGAYYLNGATTKEPLLEVTRNANAKFWIPTQNEWYKAAYYDPNKPGGAGYWEYPTSSDSTPCNDLVGPDPGNNANFDQSGLTIGSPYYMTEVGEFENSESPYGTFDQGGNAFEWNEDAEGRNNRFLRGGAWPFNHICLTKGAAFLGDPAHENDNLSFRVASVPEPAINWVCAFYNNSVWDNGDGTANAADDGAIATDKVALLPGGTATFANYTSYDKGINGLMIDVPDLPGTPTVDDFLFRKGNDSKPYGNDLDDPDDDWPWAPDPIEITVRPGEGRYGTDRVTLIWEDGVIRKCWLQVTVLATDATGLTTDEVFYLGNAVGDSGNSAADTAVNVIDALGVRANPRTLLNPAPIDFRFDFNRDKQVNVQDELIVRANPTTLLTDLNLIDLR